MKTSIWRKDWFAGLVVTLLCVVADQSTPMQSLERTAYDWGMRATTRPAASPISIIAIDENSVRKLGRWPWTRTRHAEMLDKLAAGKPKVVGNLVYFLEEQIDPGLTYLQETRGVVRSSYLATQAPAELKRINAPIPLVDGLANDLKSIDGQLTRAVDRLDTDQQLANAMGKAGNVALAMFFNLGEYLGKPPGPLPDYVLRNSLVHEAKPGQEQAKAIPANQALAPIAILGERSAAIGHINMNLDVDGAVRKIPLAVDYYGTPFPSLPLLLAARSLNLGPEDVKINPNEGIQLGNLQVHTESSLEMYPFFYHGQGDKQAFPVDSFADVLEGKIPLENYKNKIVLIGPTATGIGSSFPTPTSPMMNQVEILAHIIASILNEDFFVAPAWSFMAKLGVYLLVGLYLTLLLPLLNASAAAAITTALAAVLLGAQFGAMISLTMWLQFMGPLVLLGGGYLLLTTKRFLVSEEGKLRSDAESAESNRMLGLAFQGQGQLDMAFEKFRKCPLDDSMLEVLYNLALDFERKRQFGKAVSVYQYMADYNPDFRDLKQRMKRSTTMESTVIVGGSAAASMMATSLLSGDGEVQKPMLGRYEIEKELGKGAMGIVYLGKDPKINRVVAIKTMSLGEEFEPEELDEVKRRFFREAESAGRLNHPNIVTIYDTGEEHDLAYIAMEFLTGKDLSPYIKKDSLLPMAVVIQIIAKVAVALDYAHQNDVVHRDIKPANVMYDPEKKSIKITDFGIARLTDGGRTKTKTGMVMGTPYYMSPEQIGGKKVDGRSDIWSLGVMFYQLLTGQLPFYGKDMATLLFQITQEEPMDILQVRPNLPPCLGPILARSLDKDIDKRYQRASLMARDIVNCIKSVTQK